VDGRTYPTSVSGTVRDLISLTPLPLRVCTGGAVLALPAGRHWLSSPGTDLPLAITDLSLTDVATVPAPGRASAPASAAAPRGLRIGTWGAEYRTMTIGPGGLSYLEVHQAANPGWTATLNGHLLTPVTLDGRRAPGARWS
jgi:arabinofuranan 3-O-arabinosyltransferase